MNVSLVPSRDDIAARLAAIVESSSDAIFSVNLEGVICTWNRGAELLYGYPAAGIIGQQYTAVVPPNRVALVASEYRRVLDGETITKTDTLGRDVAGRDLHISVCVSPIRASSGRIVGTSAIARDVTERAELLSRIERDRQRLADAQASARLGSFELNPDTGEITHSDELRRILGVPDGAADVFDLERIHPDDRERSRHAFEHTAGEDDPGRTYRIIRPSGEVRWVVSRIRALGEPGNRLITGTMLDITERHEAELALAHQAWHDPLTQLRNRSSLEQWLDDRLAEGAHLAVAFIDVDRFKQINDRAGHALGDKVLRGVADRLTQGLHPTDVVARVGGDEFVLVRAGIDTLSGARLLAEDVIGALSAPLNVDGTDFDVTASVGVTINDPDDSPSSLLRAADDAMYQAKEDGRARIAVFDEASRARTQRRRILITGLGQALANDELSIVYQPILNLASESIAGFEALLRWTHPSLGAISPEEFIPLLEGTGLIIRVGEWVIDRALRDLASWRSDPAVPDALWVCINLSGEQLRHTPLVESITSAIEVAGVPPTLVHFEITESVLMNRVDQAISVISALRSTGARVSIDDFGTGYSSLSYLSRLPIDTIKIDRSFVSGLLTGIQDIAIVRTIMALAVSLSLDVVAEGIELTEQREFLLEAGCTYGQGYLWSKPLGADAALRWIKRTLRPTFQPAAN